MGAEEGGKEGAAEDQQAEPPLVTLLARLLGSSTGGGAAVVRILPGHADGGDGASEPSIWAVRHGKACRDATDAAGRPLPGRQQALLEEGVEQARATGAHWYARRRPSDDAAQGSWRSVGVFIVSPLRRTVQTARHLIEGMEMQHRRESDDAFRYPKVCNTTRRRALYEARVLSCAVLCRVRRALVVMPSIMRVRMRTHARARAHTHTHTHTHTLGIGPPSARHPRKLSPKLQP